MKLGGKNETYTSLGTTINNMNPYTEQSIIRSNSKYTIYTIWAGVFSRRHTSTSITTPLPEQFCILCFQSFFSAATNDITEFVCWNVQHRKYMFY